MNSAQPTLPRTDIPRHYLCRINHSCRTRNYEKNKQPKDSTNWSHKHDYPISEVWNTDNTLARLIAPRLIAYKELDKHGYPPDVGDMTKWNHIIQKMIDAFELMKYTDCLSEEENKTFSEGITLFCKYFRNLWD
ncbi:MAG: hypothetical protein IKN99_03370 [Bacteroidales bacterium]|nr:hypothetical protein [Bacteroidales bacterium]